MRIAAAIIALFGVLNLLSLPMGIHNNSVSMWPLLLARSGFGAYLIWIAAGIWKRHLVVWKHGFVAIIWMATAFVVQVCFKLPAVSTAQKTVIVISCSVGGILVAVYWSFVWYRQKKWFLKDAA